MQANGQGHILVNVDKKQIMEPAVLTFSGESSLFDIAFTHPQLGNLFQQEFFHLLMDEWKGDRITLVQDSQASRDYLTNQEGYEYRQEYKYKMRREVRKEGGVMVMSFYPYEIKELKKDWKQFINQYVLINYDARLFMTMDQRLLKRTKNFMPYFVLAQAEERSESNGSWAGDCIGVESIDTSTFDDPDYVEMFRMVGNKSVCQLGMEEYERRKEGQS